MLGMGPVTHPYIRLIYTLGIDWFYVVGVLVWLISCSSSDRMVVSA